VGLSPQTDQKTLERGLPDYPDIGRMVSGFRADSLKKNVYYGMKFENGGTIMKKLTILSFAVAVVLFTGCGDKGKEAATEAAGKTAETVKAASDKTAEAVQEAGKAITEATDKAAEAAKKAVETTEKAATEAVDTVKEAADTATKSVSDTADKAAGAELYKKCAGCHGVDGKTNALGKSAVIAGEAKDDLVTKINEYKAGTRNTAGMGSLMKGQVASLSDEEIQALANYISSMK